MNEGRKKIQMFLVPIVKRNLEILFVDLGNPIFEIPAVMCKSREWQVSDVDYDDRYHSPVH